MKHSIIRWLLFFTVSLPAQVVVYLLYPIAILLFRKKWKNRHGVKLDVPQDPQKGIQDIIDNGGLDGMRDEVFLDHPDNHGALLHVGIWSYKPKFVAKEALRRLVREDGGLKRYHPGDSQPPVSRDVLASWVYAYTMLGGPKDELKKVLKHYLKNAFGMTDYEVGKVSARNSSGGVNYAFDGAKGLSQPVFGPNYYTSAALFALAAKELGGVWHLVYWLHYVLMGGWLWWMEPIIYTDKDLIYYDHHMLAITMASIVHNKPSADVKYGLRRLVKEVGPQKNIDAFLYAIAWNAGVLDEKDRQNAVKVMQNIKQFWPQVPPLSSSYFGSGTPERHSMMGFHAKLLMGQKGIKL